MSTALLLLLDAVVAVPLAVVVMRAIDRSGPRPRPPRRRRRDVRLLVAYVRRDR